MKKKVIITGAVVALAIIIALTLVIIGLLDKPEPPPPRQGGVGTVATIENIEAIRMREPVQDSHYNVRMNTEWTFPTWDTESPDAYIANSERNKRTVFVTVKLKETEEIVYTSPDIPVGSQLTGFALDNRLAAGEHKGVVTYHLLDDEGAELTTVSVTVTLHVQS
jgi:hypothetical protein